MVRMIVGRLHVSATDREVIAILRRAFKHSRRRVRTTRHKSEAGREAKRAEAREVRAARHRAYREGIRIHAENRRVYAAVMHGL